MTVTVTAYPAVGDYTLSRDYIFRNNAGGTLVLGEQWCDSVNGDDTTGDGSELIHGRRLIKLQPKLSAQSSQPRGLLKQANTR